MNIGDLIDQYEQGAKLRGLAPTQMNALKPVRRGLGKMQPRYVTPLTITGYVSKRQQGHWSNVHGVRYAKNGTIRRELGALAAVLNWAHQKRILKDAPPSIDLPPMSPPREVFLALAEADGLWRHATQWVDDRTGLFVCLALDTWARANAIETLTWGRVTPTQIDYRDPARSETSKRRVPVPVSTRLLPVLAAWQPKSGRGEDLVCGPITQHQFRKFMNAMPPCITNKRLTRHDLRRTGISLAVARGVDLMKIAQMAGDNYQTILKFYARFSPSYLDGCVT